MHLVLEYFRVEVFDLMSSKFSISSEILDFMKANCDVLWEKIFLSKVFRECGT